MSDCPLVLQICVLRVLRGVPADGEERAPGFVHRRDCEEAGRDVVKAEHRGSRAVRAESHETAREIREGKPRTQLCLCNDVGVA